MKKSTVSVTAMLLAMVMLFSMVLTGCQSDGSNDKSSKKDSRPSEENPSGGEGNDSQEKDEPSAPIVTADWTIDEAIENHMRFACEGSYSLYAEDTKLYASFNSVMDSGCFAYAGLVNSGEASPTIRQVAIENYRYNCFILNSNRKLWFKGKNVFPDCNIRYFSCKSISSSGTSEVLAAVLDDGTVVWDTAYSLQKPKMQEGLEGVKYVATYKRLIAYVREDGTAGYCFAGGECHDIESWNDIAMVFLRYDETIFGLKKDGTVLAEAIEDNETHHSQEILSWSDIVYLSIGYNFVAGLKSDGSLVYAMDDDADEPSENHPTVALQTWSNIMVCNADGAIAADHTLFGKARQLVYAWNLTEPLSNVEDALREYTEDNHSHYTEKLAEID